MSREDEDLTFLLLPTIGNAWADIITQSQDTFNDCYERGLHIRDIKMCAVGMSVLVVIIWRTPYKPEPLTYHPIYNKD